MGTIEHIATLITVEVCSRTWKITTKIPGRHCSIIGEDFIITEGPHHVPRCAHMYSTDILGCRGSQPVNVVCDRVLADVRGEYDGAEKNVVVLVDCVLV